MKKRSKILLLLSTITFSTILFSCGGNEGSSSDSINNSINGEVTSIEIAGATSVLKGKTIKLVSTVDEVIWSSSDEWVASVDDQGVVTGIEAGSATIRATYKNDETIFSEIDITVYLNKALSLNAEIKGEDVLLKEDNSYDVTLGKVFDVYVSVNEGYSIPDFSFEIQYPIGSEIDNVVSLTPDPLNPGHATLIAYYALDEITLVCKGAYSDLATAVLIKSLVFNVVDKNEDNINEVNTRLDNVKETEKSSLISYKSNYSLKFIDNENSSSSYENITESIYNNYLNSSYVSTSYTYKDSQGNIIYKDFDGDEIPDSDDIYYSSNNYQGILNNNYYAFDYNDNEEITTLYFNETVNDRNKDNVNFAMNPNNTNIKGISGLLDNILNSTNNVYENIISLGNIYAYANAKFDIDNDRIAISSDYTDIDTGLKYDIELILLFENEKITSITYNQTIIGETYKYEFTGEYIDFVYDTKIEDSTLNSKYINVADYYMTSYDLVELAGTKTDLYDYSDLTKYGANNVSEENGLTKYTLTTDKTLVLKIANYTPNKASTLIDRVVASSSNVDQIPNVSLTGSDVFSINAKKNDDSISLPGKATFTFKSTLGIEKKIVVEFVKAELKAVFTSNVPSENDFGNIFKNDLTPYFFINTNPDEDLYSFGIEILQGPENGIELYEHQNGNLDGNPGFSYSIKGLIVGSYRFKIYVKENPEIKTENEYKIIIDEVYSSSYIKSNLVNENVTYRYSTGLVEYDMQFTTDTLITYTFRAYGDEVKKSINYHIEDGVVYIDGDQNLGTNAYFSWIKGGNIKFARNFETITMYLETYYEQTNEDLINLRHYYPVTFKKVVDKTDFESYIDNKTFEVEEFIYGGLGMARCTISFSDGNGTLLITPNEGGNSTTITFGYTYDKIYSQLKFTNISSSSSKFVLEKEADFNINNDTLKIELTYNGQDVTLIFSV